MLAPFECCDLWCREGLDAETLPKWVIEHLAGIAAGYYRGSPFSAVTPRKFRELSTMERAKLEPDLNKIAGLRGTSGKPSAWLWRAEHDRDPYLDAYLADWEARARADPDLRLETSDGREIRILDNHGRLRSEAADEIAQRFGVGGPGAGWGQSKAKTVRRRRQTHKDADK